MARYVWVQSANSTLPLPDRQSSDAEANRTMLIKMRVNRSRYRPHHCCRQRTIFVTFLLTILILCLIVRRLFILAWLGYSWMCFRWCRRTSTCRPQIRSQCNRIQLPRPLTNSHYGQNTSTSRGCRNEWMAKARGFNESKSLVEHYKHMWMDFFPLFSHIFEFCIIFSLLFIITSGFCHDFPCHSLRNTCLVFNWKTFCDFSSSHPFRCCSINFYYLFGWFSIIACGIIYHPSWVLLRVLRVCISSSSSSHQEFVD